MTATKLKLLLALPIIAMALGFLALPHSAKAATYTVTNTDDAGAGTLRQAITDANANSGADTIAFNIAGAGVHTIAPLTNLPAVTDQVTIDGSTQPAASCNPRTLLIEIDGENLDTLNGLHLSDGSSGSTIKGLVINRVTNTPQQDMVGFGILVDGDSGSNTIICNNVGTNAAGDAALPNYIGIAFNANAMATGSNNTVGGPTVAERNVISGNTFAGLFAQSISGLTIKGNYVGLTADGTGAIGNGGFGLYLVSGTNLNIGGVQAGEGNVIATQDTSYYGILLSNSSNSTVQGNYVGVNPAGEASLGGVILYGVVLNTSTDITVGGTTAGAGNVVSAAYGMYTFELTLSTIQGNKIGTNAAGDACITGQIHAIGILVDTATDNTIGGNTPAARNLISCQKTEQDSPGIGLIFTTSDSENNIIQGNYIGTNGNGQVQSGFGNEGDGILIGGGIDGSAINNLFGGTGAGEGNVIAGNGGAGINFNAPAVDPQDPDVGQPLSNAILGNSIHDNGELGIAFTEDGDQPWSYAVTPNDSGDPDYGPNHLMNFPVINSVTSTNGTATITYDLDINDAEPGATGYRVEFFANDSADPSGHGQGQTYIGSDTVAGDVTGQQVTITLPNGVDGSKYITATTTMTDASDDGFGHTSEFAADVQATLAPPTPTPGPTPTPDPTPAPAGSSTDASSLAGTGQAQHTNQRLFIALALIAAGVLGVAGLTTQRIYTKRRKGRV